MKTRRLLSVVLLVSLFFGCSKREHIIPVGDNNFFAGMYNPYNRVQSLRMKSHIVGVECGDEQVPDHLVARFFWSTEHLDSIIHYDDYASPETIRYHYDKHGRLIRVESSAVSNRDYVLGYEGSRLVSITRNVGEWLYEYTFTYTDDSDYPVAYAHHYKSLSVEGTDTYTLRWKDGNLVSAVCGANNDYYTIDSITYTYDTRTNPFCGFFSSNGLREFGIVHAPTFISRNNIVAITYHTDNGPVQNVFYSLNYKFSNDIPTQIIRDYENMFWCHITDTATLLY